MSAFEEVDAAMVQKQAHWQLLLRFLLITGTIAVSPLPALAQRIPIADDTLGNERSLVSPERVINNLPSNQIDGGAQRGANLFHSFQEFNIDNGRGVYFTNPAGVTNILTRVSGGNPSQILGALGVLGGNANLFLLNPNGILFGPNARLEVGGSFVASTANSVVFDNAFAFSATNPPAPPLLTVSVPLGLQYGSNPGALQVQGTLLQVPNGQTLILAGGAVNVDGAGLFAPGGRVELAGVAAGEVGLTQQGQEWRLSVPNGLSRADVAIRNNAIVNVRSGGGGSIGINARNLTITGAETRVRAGIAAGLGTVDAQAGDIDINATEAVNLDAILISNAIEPSGTGNAGDITITTNTLSLTGGTSLSATTFGQGDAGNITIVAGDAVSFDGTDSDGLPSGAYSQVALEGIGQGGDISITTGSLSLTDGGQVSTITFGQGDVGDITIRARDRVSIDGVGSNGFNYNSGIFSDVNRGIGEGGDIRITTGSLSLTNGGVVTASTRGQGDAGSITITAKDSISFDGIGGNGSSVGVLNGVDFEGIGQGGDINITTGNLSLTNGAQLLTSTRGQGDAGNITITARDAVSFDGVKSNGSPSATASSVFPGGIGEGGDIRITTGSLSLTNGGVVTASTRGQGDAGSITITAKDSISFDGMGGISASSEGGGDAGNLDVTARQLRLDNRSTIQAQTTSGQGGNIRLQIQDYLLLRQGSFISTTAGTAQAGGDGGNITFKGNFIVAVPNEDSDITANAFTGKGGRVEINAQGIFGTQFRLKPTPLSDITASSTFGAPGTVAINTPDVDPNRGLVQLPVDVTDASRLIVQTCPTGNTTANQSNEFVVTGRGGLPPTPSEAVNRDAIQVDLVTTNAEEQPSISPNQPDQTSSPRTTPPTQLTYAPLVEAQSWQIGTDGRVVLVAAAPQNAIAPSSNRPVHCP